MFSPGDVCHGRPLKSLNTGRGKGELGKAWATHPKSACAKSAHVCLPQTRGFSRSEVFLHNQPVCMVHITGGTVLGRACVLMACQRMLPQGKPCLCTKRYFRKSLSCLTCLLSSFPVSFKVGTPGQWTLNLPTGSASLRAREREFFLLVCVCPSFKAVRHCSKRSGACMGNIKERITHGNSGGKLRVSTESLIHPCGTGSSTQHDEHVVVVSAWSLP